MRGSSVQKINLASYDDLFGGDGQASGEAVTSVPIRELHPFKGHPFRVLDDAKMGASQSTGNIFKSWCRMLGGQIFLLVMNAWCLRLFTSMVGTFLANPLSL